MKRAAWMVTAAAATLLILPADPAAAQSEPKRIGAFRDWEAYTYVEAEQKVCYAATRPTKAEGNYTKRGDIHLVVVRRPKGEEISLYPGYTYKKDSEVQIAIGAEKFQLITHEDSAWTKDPDHDKLLLAAMRKAGDMVATGTSARGNLTTDTFSLRGLSQALEEAEKACASAPPKAAPAAQNKKPPPQKAPAQKAPAQQKNPPPKKPG